MKILHIFSPHWLTTIISRTLSYLSHLRVLWRVWDLRTFTLVSLALQTLLIVFAPFRKQSSNLSAIVSIWLAYLLADYIAIQAVGLIPNYSHYRSSSSSPHNATDHVFLPHHDLLAFWSPFLLVHLGGPDTITALALEDNELWLRTALHLFTQVSSTGRVFFQSLPSSRLWLPTVLMFAAGVLKYTERILSLYYARLTKFKSSMLKEPDPGPNYAKLMESYHSYLKFALPARFDTNPDPDQNTFDARSDPEQNTLDARSNKKELRNVRSVREAFTYFEKYKGLYVDMIFSHHDRTESREDFLKRSSEEAFKVIETELNFTFEVFYTKMVVIHRTFGTIIRCISCVCEVLSLFIWILFVYKKPYHNKDIRITYTLLGGAIVLDVVAVLRVLFSDWKIALLDKESKVRASLYEIMLSVRDRTWGEYWGKEDCPWRPYLRRLFFRRWSESVPQFNLITYCVDPWSKGVKILLEVFPLQDKFDEMAYVSKKWFADDLRDFIFNEIRYKAEIAEDPVDAVEVCESTGDWVLRSLAGLDFDPYEFYPWTADVEYDECLLIWHIATELLYQDGTKGQTEKKTGDYRKYCKTLSDYMMYLLNQQPGMMLSVTGISEVRFRDTCAEATKFLNRVVPKTTLKPQRHKEACKRIMGVNTAINPREIKGDRSKSVLFDACRLAKKLQELELQRREVGMWELMAKVWVELVSYAATHCRANAHAAQLKQGGELLTLVWLLMVHFGLGRQFRITQGNARSKLIISKY